MQAERVRLPEKRIIAGIAGGSGSGKTTVLRELVKLLPPGSSALVSQDNYYHPVELQQRDPNGWHNFELPEAIDHSRFVADLHSLCRGESLRRPEYTFNNPQAMPGWIEVHTAPIIIVEGLFVFHFEGLFDMFDISVFVDADPGIRLSRRIRRDFEERGYDRDSVLYQWENHVEPAYKKWLEPHREKCDFIVDNSIDYREQLIDLSAVIMEKAGLA